MDLREKPGKVQKMLELMLRFRLIFVVVMVAFVVMFLATGWQMMGSMPLGASEALGMWFAKIEDAASAWDSAQYLFVAAVAMLALFFVFGGVRSGISGIVSTLLFVAALFFLSGDEEMLLIFFGSFALLSLILILVAKWSVACILFPFAVAWLLMTGFLGWFPMMVGNAWLMWAVLSGIGFASCVSTALIAGQKLGEGTPVTGALIFAGKKMLLPVVISSLLALAALTVDMGTADGKSIGAAAILWVSFFVWFFGFLFGTASFAPWERLRAGSRRVQMKKKKAKVK